MIDIIAKLFAAVLLLAFCAGIAVVVFFKVIEQPSEHSGIVIDIQPDGGGLEGDLDRRGLEQSIRAATSAARKHKGEQTKYAGQ